MSTAIEKQSLEAHVEICSERYEALEYKLDNMERRVEKIETGIGEIKSAISASALVSSDRLIKIGTSLFAVLMTACIGLIVHLVLK
jgi:prefoldin subunit 5